ncbi:Uncharacterised protein [Suttonella ornithocola]|uniref:Uncharacterized protein n=1 Tax=Suttonella ornithocola TaxID=279832 RepID=A0A380MT09_9GAMM|nr:Uncharacterised protein [Suttonella ornithocola]
MYPYKKIPLRKLNLISVLLFTAYPLGLTAYEQKQKTVSNHLK